MHNFELLSSHLAVDQSAWSCTVDLLTPYLPLPLSPPRSPEMPVIPLLSPATGKPTPDYYIHTTNGSFIDNNGRTLLLRGVNLSGSDKAPVNKPSYLLDELGENGGESFVGRPFNLEDGSADVHLARLRGWGFNMIRYVVTWEALEHAGPGKYDFEFMDYTVEVLRKCKEYGFKVYMDPHQDVWSRYSGGSGAPYWTLPACGIDTKAFVATKAALVHAEYPTRENPDPASVPAMIWGTNYNRLVSQTMFTLFFAGRDFAPKCIIDGQNIQDWLQSHFIEAYGLLAERIRDASDLLDECVIGWDSMNEPFEGMCGIDDLNHFSKESTATLKKGPTPTPAQGFRLGMGQPQEVEYWEFGSFGPKMKKMVTIDPKGAKIWARPRDEGEDGVNKKWGWRRDPGWSQGTCIWASHGVWDVESGELLKPDYFCVAPGKTRLPFVEQWWRPHWKAFQKRIKPHHPECIWFIQPPVFALPPHVDGGDLEGRCCYSAHYYDGLTLVSRHWNWFNADALGCLRHKYSHVIQALRVGEKAIRASIQQQLGELKSDAKIIGDFPTIIGEIGTPFDMDGKRAYGYTDGGKYRGDYSRQQKALDASMNASDGPNALSWTIWTYCPDSSHMWGDGWNMEDLSLWSPDDKKPSLGMSPKTDTLRSGESSTALLKNASAQNSELRLPRLATPSSISLRTLTSPGVDGDNDGMKVPFSGADSWKNAYDFLTDGARAVKAFCRPWPIATVGTPKDIQFTIADTEFRLTVVVRPEDFPKRRPESDPPSSSASSVFSSSSSSLCDDLDDPTYPRNPTEIYLPLVHYAHPSLVATTNGQSLSSLEELGPDEEGNISQVFPPPSQNGSATTLVAVPHSPADGPCPLSIDVEVSDGKWEVHGQTLKWWYPVPQQGDEPKEYTIKVKRAGGSIKTLEEMDREARLATVGGWCEEFCSGSSCTIM